MSYSTMPRSAQTERSQKKPGAGWVKLENFLDKCGMMYTPDETPIRETVQNVRVENEGRRVVRMEDSKMKKARVFSIAHELQNEINISTPMNINQASEPADKLKAGKTIFCNFTGIEKANLEQVRFFLMGVVYAIGGNCRKINDTCWFFTPPSMNITQDEPEREYRKERKDKIPEDEVIDQFFGT